MAFMIVNDRQPRADAYCGFCCEPIVDGYIREIGTRILYCCYEHYRAHVQSAVLAIEHHPRLVS